jgi:hypothetical protein
MRRSTVVMLAFAVTSSFFPMSSSDAQLDVAKILVGKWEGDIQTRGMAGDPNRTLIIDTVAEREGGWAVKAQYGVTGGKLSHIDATLDKAGDQFLLKFVVGAQSKANVSLRLHDDKHLVGTYTLSGGSRTHQRERDQVFRLEKVE